MSKRPFYRGGDLPLGLSMCMAQNPYAFECFAKLSDKERRELIMSAESSPGSSRRADISDRIIGGKGSTDRYYPSAF